MKYEEYLHHVNKTWKTSDKWSEELHIRLAIVEEVGEIAGWYKKHVGYGRPKDDAWLVEVKGELGDLLYYLTKLAELIMPVSKYGYSQSLTERYLSGEELEEINYVSDLDALADMTQALPPMMTASCYNAKLNKSLCTLVGALRYMIEYLGFTLENIQQSNIAKLKARHGDSFKDSAMTEEGRDRHAESEALRG